jgi:aryl-alcohol dehydrogenase-like predicted oxidoreductase
MNLINKIGLGTAQFGMVYGIANESGQTSATEVKNILEYASIHNINFIDTASAYGNAEDILGINDLIGFKVISKYMPPSENGSIEDQFKNSLNKLNLNALYGYLAHRPLDLLNNKKQWGQLMSLKENGKIEKIGYSLNQPDELNQLLNKGMIPDLIQVPFNYFDNRFKNLMMDLKIKGCEIHTRSTFLQGLFFIDADQLHYHFNPVKEVLRELQSKFRDCLSGALLKYVLSLDYVDIVIMGVENKIQLINNLAKFSEIAKLEPMNLNIGKEILMPSMWPKM